MLLSLEPKLQDHIIEYFLTRGISRVADLRSHLASRGLRVSKQAVYADLRTLIKQNVLMKRGDRYDVHLTWVSELQRMLAARLSLSGSSSALSDGESETFSTTSMLDLHRTWSSLILDAVLRAPRAAYYELLPHYWLPLGDSRSEQQLLRAFKNNNTHYHSVITRVSELDRWTIQSRAKIPGDVALLSESTEKLASRHLSVLGDTIVTIKPDSQLLLELDEIFNSSCIPPSHEMLRGLTTLLTRPTKVDIVYERNQTKAATITNLLREALGRPEADLTHHGARLSQRRR